MLRVLVSAMDQLLAKNSEKQSSQDPLVKNSFPTRNSFCGTLRAVCDATYLMSSRSTRSSGNLSASCNSTEALHSWRTEALLARQVKSSLRHVGDVRHERFTVTPNCTWTMLPLTCTTLLAWTRVPTLCYQVSCSSAQASLHRRELRQRFSLPEITTEPVCAP